MGDQAVLKANQLLGSSTENVRSSGRPAPFSIFVPSPVLPVRTSSAGSGKRATKEKVIYPRRVTNLSGSPPFTGGAQLSKQMAMRLRQLVFGASLAPPRQEWLKGGFAFQPPDGRVAYGLQTPQPLTQPLLMAVQTRVIKHLLFQRCPDSADVDSVFRPRQSEQQRGLASALSDVIWGARAGGSAHVCLCSEAQQVWGDTDYLPDGVTERVQHWTFNKKDDLNKFISTYIKEFESADSHGYLLLLYSLVLSRGINRVSDDLGQLQPSLLTAGGAVTHGLTNLVLSGQASPLLHNGTVWQQMAAGAKVARHGVPERCDVGFLLWEEATTDLLRTEVGSRLKTPLLPIWLTCCHGQYGVLFHLNRDLTRDYRAEHRFDLHYYTGDEAHLERPTLIAVDTKSRPPEPCREDGEEESLPSLDELILSKWPEAAIDWRGTEPYL